MQATKVKATCGRKAIVPGAGGDRNRLAEHYRDRAVAVLRGGDEDRFAWLLNGRRRDTILSELGQIADDAKLMTVAARICEEEPKALDAAAMLRQFRRTGIIPPATKTSTCKTAGNGDMVTDAEVRKMVKQLKTIRERASGLHFDDVPTKLECMEAEARRIEAVCRAMVKECSKAFDRLGIGDAHVRSRLDRFKAKIESAARIMLGARGTAVCEKCGGEGCPACKDMGWVCSE